MTPRQRSQAGEPQRRRRQAAARAARREPGGAAPRQVCCRQQLATCAQRRSGHTRGCSGGEMTVARRAQGDPRRVSSTPRCWHRRKPLAARMCWRAWRGTRALGGGAPVCPRQQRVNQSPDAFAAPCCAHTSQHEPLPSPLLLKHAAHTTSEMLSSLLTDLLGTASRATPWQVVLPASEAVDNVRVALPPLVGVCKRTLCASALSKTLSPRLVYAPGCRARGAQQRGGRPSPCDAAVRRQHRRQRVRGFPPSQPHSMFLPCCYHH